MDTSTRLPGNGARSLAGDAPMEAPARIQLKRAKGWRLPPGAISVARPTRWGNPFAIGGRLDYPNSAISGSSVRDRAHAVELFAAYARNSAGYSELARRELAGKPLACWCPLPADGEPDICHAAVLLALVNAEANNG